MSGGDGKGHNSGAHSTGGVNGSSGKGGPSSGKGGYDGHNLGGHTTNNGNGTSTTTDNRGAITHQNGGSSGSGVHWGGGSGHGNGGGQGGNTGSGKPSVALAFGVPVLLGPTAGEMGFALSGEAVSAAMAEAFGLLKGPFKFGLWGVALYGILPGEIAKDDQKMMSKIVTSLPADTVTETPASALPLQQATVRVKQRVVDVVKDERQHIAVVAGQPMSVPVVDAKPTKRPGVFSASVPGLPDLHVSVTKGVPVAKTQPKGLTPEKGASRPAGFTAGGSSHDAVIRFPKESGQKPVYVSVTNVLTPAQVKQRQEEEKRLQREWDAAHPVEVAARELDAANKELSAAQAQYNQADKRHQAAMAGFKRFSSVNYGKEKGELATLEAKMAELNKAKADAINRGGTDPRNNGYGQLMWALRQIKVVGPQWEAKKTTVTGYEKAKKELDSSTVALNSALESRKQKEQKAKGAKDKFDKENKRNKPGVATGKGKPVGDKWLEDAGKESGAPVPDRIANKLRGKEFKNFDDFRKKFWEEVSKDPELSKQFIKGNRDRMRAGKAPKSRKKDAAGKRTSFELHHDKPISQDGGVYDMDNLRITTPKRHIDIHRGK